MPASVSYSIGYTAIGAAGTTVTVTPPPCYGSGDLLVMGVIGGGTAGAVTASAPSGWSALSGSGTPGVFTKTAGSEPASYTVTLSGTATAAVFVAALPAATVVSGAFHASGADVVTYSPAFPGGVTAGETVLLAAAAVAAPTDVTGNLGAQTLNLPAGWTTEVPVFGQSMPVNASSVYPAAIGLASFQGSTSTPALTSPQGCGFYACYIVLNVTGTAGTLAVTAASAAPEGLPGLALTVKALTGAQSPAAIAAGGASAQFYANLTSQPPQAAITPNASGSYVYGAATENIGAGSAAFTANGSTTFSLNAADATWGAVYGTFRSTSTTTAGTPLTLGGTAPANAYTTVALAEILAASALAETATATALGRVPGDFPTTSVAQTAVFRTAPAAGTLLVAMVSANSSYGQTSVREGSALVAVTDSSGLTWTPLAQVAYPSYSGVWVAQVPSPGSFGPVLDEGGNPVLDESGAGVTDETGVPPGTVPGVTATIRVTAVPGYPPGPRTVTGTSLVAVRAVAGTVQAGSAASGVILDESGAPVLDESGTDVLDESGGSPVPPPVFSGAWSAARAGMPADATAVNAPAQAAQFLVTHGIAAVRQGTRAWVPAAGPGGAPASFGWGTLATGGGGLLAQYDVSQPFVLPSGTTAAGRAAVALLPAGSGADLLVRLCPDNGSGSPNLSSVLAQAVIPASHVTSLAAAAGLPGSGPLQVARYNAAMLGTVDSQPWASPAVSSAGAGNYAAPCSSGNWTVFAGGVNAAGTQVTQVTTVSYQGSGLVSGAVPVSPLPQAASLLVTALTTDTMVAAGGYSGSAWLSSAWAASWDGNGTVGSWSAQASLPAACGYGAMASSGESVYVLAGSPNGTAASASAATWWATVSGGSFTSWTAGPQLPVACSRAYLAAVGGWLVAAGGVDTSGNALSSTWVSQIGAAGAPGPWQPGPALPYPAYAFAPGWNLAVTGSAVIIVSGPTTGGTSLQYAMSLTVSADGPAPEWQSQGYSLNVDGDYQCAAYPSGAGGNWTAVGFHLGSYASAQVYPVPLTSVPLPASGLTAGATYHLVIHQDGGNAASYLQPGFRDTGGTPLLAAAQGSTGPWTPIPGLQLSMAVYDQTPSGALLHLYEDGGARVTTLARDSGGDLIGILDSTLFPAGSPEAVLSAVTQVTWENGMPSGLVPLA